VAVSGAIWHDGTALGRVRRRIRPEVVEIINAAVQCHSPASKYDGRSTAAAILAVQCGSGVRNVPGSHANHRDWFHSASPFAVRAASSLLAIRNQLLQPRAAHVNHSSASCLRARTHTHRAPVATAPRRQNQHRLSVRHCRAPVTPDKPVNISLASEPAEIVFWYVHGPSINMRRKKWS